jgi:hypothetical protein
MKAGEIAGEVGLWGYVWIEINGTNYMAQDLAWLSVHGDFPSGPLEHINGDKTDNRIANLRPVARRASVCGQLH